MASNPSTLNMVQNKLVSILVPVYNREQMIDACIQSALAQTYANIEVIVVDNASTDGTVTVCEGIAARDPRVKVFVNDTNIGPVRNWQRCLQEASGYYAKLLFSDDLLAPTCLEETLPFLDQEGAGFVFTSAWIGNEPFSGRVYYRYLQSSGISPSEKYIAMALFSGDVPVSPCAALFRLEDLKKNLLCSIPSPLINDFPAHGAGPDLLTYLLTAVSYPTVAFVDKPLVHFRSHPESITMSDKACYLASCYRQARIWFAENHLPERFLRRLWLYEWKRESSQQGCWLPLKDMLRKYTYRQQYLPWYARFIDFALAKLHKKGCLTVSGLH